MMVFTVFGIPGSPGLSPCISKRQSNGNKTNYLYFKLILYNSFYDFKRRPTMVGKHSRIIVFYCIMALKSIKFLKQRLLETKVKKASMQYSLPIKLEIK